MALFITFIPYIIIHNKKSIRLHFIFINNNNLYHNKCFSFFMWYIPLWQRYTSIGKTSITMILHTEPKHVAKYDRYTKSVLTDKCFSYTCVTANSTTNTPCPPITLHFTFWDKNNLHQSHVAYELDHVTKPSDDTL